MPVRSDADAGQSEERIETYKAARQSGLYALKAALFLNGGAAIAFLAFVGNFASQSGINPEQASSFSFVMKWFVSGAFLAVVASGLSYLANLFHSYEWDQWANAALVIAIVFGALSLGAFLYGGWTAADAFTIQ